MRTECEPGAIGTWTPSISLADLEHLETEAQPGYPALNQSLGSERVQTAASTDPASVLYADDDPNLRLCVSWFLARCGYAVTTAADGAEACEALRSSACDLLITDHQMPGMTGAQLILRARLEGLTLPIIVVTGDPESFVNSSQPGLQVAAVLPKPFALGRLLEAVQEALATAPDLQWRPAKPPPVGSLGAPPGPASPTDAMAPLEKKAASR